MNNQKLTQEQKQTLRLSPVQILAIQMVEKTNQMLENEIRKEIDENPALSIDDTDEQSIQEENHISEDDDNLAPNDESDHDETELDYTESLQDYYEQNDIDDDDPTREYELRNPNYSPDDTPHERIIVSDNSLQENLRQQLGELDLNEHEYQIGEFLIGYLDESGYIRRDIQLITNDLLLDYINTDITEVEYILRNYIQELDPAGIGAKDLQECLLLQLKRRKKSETVTLARNIIENHFDAFTKRNFETIIERLSIDEKQFALAYDEIKSCDPRPAATTSQIDLMSNAVIPDFIVTIEEGKLVLTLNNSHLPKLKIDPEFQQLLEGKKRYDPQSSEFIKEYIDKAQNFILALSQREETLYKTMNFIMHWQQKYFLTGDEADLKPMILNNVASSTGLDVSTVSRVSNSKYIQTPFGTIPVKKLFAEAVNEDVTSNEIKQKLLALIQNEDKRNPITDEKLRLLLQEAGYDIARRTVAKYREQLNISTARLRRGL